MGELIRAEDHIHLVLRDELLVDADGRGGLGAVVLRDQLELPSQDAALLVRVLDAELVAAKPFLPSAAYAPVWDADAPIRIGG